jgi:hypothetical protein
VGDACRHVAIGHEAVGPDGLVHDSAVRAAIVDVVLAVLA